ncbi:MAG: TRAP transporter small permease subunit [Natronospirillum sp.]|uniref:TRAP transporter small permease subunit n=1 Tax=Natronospirillum sp. TaxID=2812955 RepID=UPI0025E8A205|nr:TRAP transporter small permease subunit [Natronospirillum sp.]MCH8552090.1 TRAP transporter small permease subunit [Natronospirillum sp.]
MSEQNHNRPSEARTAEEMVQAIVPGAVEARQELPTNIISRPVDAALRFIGQLAAWLWVATIAVITINVVDRFIFGRGSVALEELSWHFFGAAMLLSLSYAVVTDDHVRVDFLRERFSLKTRSWIDLLGILLLALPVFFIITEETISYAYRSFISGERSQSASGLRHRFVLKSVMPIAFSLLMIALASRVLRCSSYLFNFPRAIWPDDDGPSGPNDQTKAGDQHNAGESLSNRSEGA